MRVKFFYRCGGNYKSTFEKDIDDSIVEQLILDHEGVENLIDSDFSSDPLIEMEEFDLSIMDIPVVSEFGYDDELDHNFVSIVAIGDE